MPIDGFGLAIEDTFIVMLDPDGEKVAADIMLSAHASQLASRVRLVEELPLAAGATPKGRLAPDPIHRS